MDDPFVTCPYNVLHQVPKSRIQRHLVKCEKQYPPLVICPYNATHRYPKETIKAHIADCPSKTPVPLEEKALYCDYKNQKRYDNGPINNNDDDEDWD